MYKYEETDYLYFLHWAQSIVRWTVNARRETDRLPQVNHVLSKCKTINIEYNTIYTEAEKTWFGEMQRNQSEKTRKRVKTRRM